MELTPLEIVYCVAFFLGFGFAVVSALLSGVFHVGGEGHGHVDMPGHVEIAHHDFSQGDHVAFSPVSPVTVSMFITTFGVTGFALSKWVHLSPAVHFPIAMLSGLIVAAAVFAAFAKILRVTQSSSVPSTADAVGLEAELTFHTVRQGRPYLSHEVASEIAFSETRLNATAKAVDGKELPQGARVRIVRIDGTTFVIEKVR